MRCDCGRAYRSYKSRRSVPRRRFPAPTGFHRHDEYAEANTPMVPSSVLAVSVTSSSMSPCPSTSAASGRGFRRRHLPIVGPLSVSVTGRGTRSASSRRKGGPKHLGNVRNGVRNVACVYDVYRGDIRGLILPAPSSRQLVRSTSAVSNRREWITGYTAAAKTSTVTAVTPVCSGSPSTSQSILMP